MKHLKKGRVNTLSFVKLASFTGEFTVKLSKVVGDYELTFEGLTDNNNYDSCKDFITLNIDLLSEEYPLEDGGEYTLTLINGSDEYTYLVHIEDYISTQTGSGIYGDSVRFVDL